MAVVIRLGNGAVLSGELQRVTYADGSLALQLDDVEEGPEVLSANLAAFGRVPPPAHVYVKDYGEHVGLVGELVRVGAAELVDEVRLGPAGSRYALVRLL